jgi:hypothetical protein
MICVQFEFEVPRYLILSLYHVRGWRWVGVLLSKDGQGEGSPSESVT